MAKENIALFALGEYMEEAKQLSDEELEKVAGGSMRLTEADAKKCGITLKKEDGSPGEFHWYWNIGDYYWNGSKISNGDVRNIKYFVTINGRQPGSLKEAEEFRFGGYNRRRR